MADPIGPPGFWTEVWSDEFPGSSVDTTKWWVDDGGTTRNGIPCYASNVTVSGGYLRITALNASSGGNVMSANCQPGTTTPSNGYRLPVGGCVEARVTFPGDGAGSIYNWPAFWALGTVLGSPYPAAGEIDIAEVNGWGGGPGGGLTVNYHGTTNSYNSGVQSGTWDSAFHTYTLVRHASSFDVYFDGELKVSHATGDDGSPMGILLVNGKGGVASYPQTMLVDYVRAWMPASGPPATWTSVQTSAEAAAQNSVPLAFEATTAKTMLVACLAAPSTAGFTPPGPASNGSVWKRGPHATSAGGTVEQWYLYPAPAGMTSATFTTSGVAGGYSSRGFATEQQPPAGTVEVFYGATGAASGTDGASFTTSPLCGNSLGDLGIYLFGVFFAAAPTSTGWTTPAGFTELKSHRTGVSTCFWAGAAEGLAAGVQGGLASGLAYSGPTSTGYAGAFGAYQALSWVTPRIDGAEVLNVICSDPSGQVLIAGGDVWGLFRSCDGGDTWRAAQAGFLTPGGQLAIGCVQWSAMPGEPATVYAVTGKSEDGGIFRSVDGGVTWAKRNTTPLGFKCNDPGSPPQPGGEPQINNRSAGRLLAQDAGRGILLAATHHDGVYRSADGGVTWAYIGLSGVYLRGLVCDPAVTTVFAAAWDSPAGTGGVYQCYDYTVTNPSWSQNPNTVFTVSDLLLLGGFVYALGTGGGLYRHSYDPYVPDSFPNVNPAGVDTSSSSIWTGMDGYVTGGNHKIVMACHQGVHHGGKTYNSTALRVTIPAGGPPGTLEEIIADSTMDWHYQPDGTERWDYNIHTGTAMWANHHVLIHPSDRTRIYIVGGAQTFRTYDNCATWHLANIGQCSFGLKVLAIDPVNPRHLVWCSDDYSHYDVTWAAGKLPGYDAANVVKDTSFPAPGDPEAHAVCFDPVSGDVYHANNTGYSQNTGGRVCLRRAGDATFTWINTNYHLGPPPGGAVTAGNAPMGLYAGRDGASRYLVVVTQGAGVFRATSADGGATWTWAKVDSVIGTSGNLNQHVPIVGTSDAALLYLFDRKRGVYRSTDRGATWVQVWAKVISSNTRCGWLAADPADKSSLWVTTGDGLYHLPHADTKTYANPSSLPGFSGGSGGLAWYGSALYVITPPTASQPYARVLTTADHGATWADVAGDQFGATCSDSRGLYVTADGLLMAGTSTSLMTMGYAQTAASDLLVATTTLPAGAVAEAYT